MTFRNPENIQPVVDGEVLVSFAEDPKIGTDGTFGDDWYTLGILNDGSRVELNRTIDKNKTSGWGYGVVAVDTRPGELTATAETLEDNEATRAIAWPTRKPGDGARIEGAQILYHDEKVARPFVALVEKMQDGTTRIRASRERAIATMEDIGFGQEVSGRQVSFDFQTGRNKDAFDELVLTDGAAETYSESIIRFDTGADGSTRRTSEEAPEVEDVTGPADEAGATAGSEAGSETASQ